MPRIFAYIAHKDGIADDCAAELLTAAQRIDANAAPIALVAGMGCGTRSRLRVRPLFL